MSSVASTEVSLVSTFSDNDLKFNLLDAKLQRGCYILNSKIPAPFYFSFFIFIFNVLQTLFLNISRSNNHGTYSRFISNILTEPWLIFAEKSYFTFFVILILTFIFVLFNVILFIWVLQKEDLTQEIFLKFTSILIFLTTHAFFVPILNIFITSFECDWKKSSHLYFKGVSCLVFPNDLAMTLSAFGAIGLIILSIYSQY